MSDEKKFEAFKRQLVEETERLYGAESREKYGGAEVDASNAGNGHGLAAERIARGFQARLNRGRAELTGLPIREVQAVSLALFRESAGDMDRKYL